MASQRRRVGSTSTDLGVLPDLSATSARGLLLALFPHLRGRHSRLADLALAEAEAIHRLEEKPPQIWIDDHELPGAEVRDEMIQDRLDALAGLDLGRGRGPRVSVYREYAQAMNLVERAVNQYWCAFRNARNPRPAWRQLLLQLWDVLSAWPQEVRPRRPLPEALVDTVVTVKRPETAARVIVAAAAGIPDTDSFRRLLSKARSDLKS